MRQWRVRIYRSQVTLPAALTAPPVLQEWSAWRDLRGAGRDRCIPAGPGLYRIRHAGGEPAVGVPGRSRADLSWAAPDTLNSVSG
jgi:hypothetical protein